MERVYLGDWLYNAGIVGLLKALGVERFEEGRAKDAEGKEIEGIRAEDNFVEIDREHFKNFANKYYEAAALKEILIGLSSTKDKLKTAKEKLKKLESESFDEIEKLGKSWLEKGFFSFGGSRKLYESIEIAEKRLEVHFHNETKALTIKKQIIPCVLCQERPAKENLYLKTHISSVAGISRKARNFVDLRVKNEKLRDIPLCEVCQAVVACAPLGFSLQFQNQNKKIQNKNKKNKFSRYSFIFINNTSSINELFNDNMLLSKTMSAESGSVLTKFFSEKILRTQTETSIYSILGISVVKLEVEILTKGRKSSSLKVNSLALDFKEAELFSKEKFLENLEKLKGANYFIDKERKYLNNLLLEILDKILKKDTSTGILFELLKLYLQYLNRDKNNTKGLIINFNSKHLHILNIILVQSKQILEDKLREVSTKELNFLFREGKELRKAFKRRKNEKKADSIAFRLLSALKTGDAHKFMDVLIRTYTSVEREIPSAFVRNLNDEEAFKHCGYSFVSGLISSENAKESGGENEQE